MPGIERRYASGWGVGRIEARAEDSRTVAGHAALFNTLSGEIYGFREQIEPGAFARAIKEDDVKALWNHNRDLVLGRNGAGTLTLGEDKRGLTFEIEMPDSPLGENALASIRRGDVSEMSFSFRAIREEWQAPKSEKDLPTRTLKEVRLFDVSPVAFPAYPGTDVSARSVDYEGALEALEAARREWTEAGNAAAWQRIREAEALGWFREGGNDGF